MAIIPAKNALKSGVNSADILNYIRHNASEQYKNMTSNVRYGNSADLSNLAKTMYDYTPIRNEFMSTLYNMIAVTLVTNKLYDSPVKRLKRGIIENGEDIREIFVDLVNSHNYNMEVASEQFMKIEKPNVLAAFHSMNYQKFYKVTITRKEINLAFTSWSGVDDLISKIIVALSTSANYDEYQTFKYMVARAILNGMLKPVNIPALTKDTSHDVTEIMRCNSLNMTFMSRERNLAGVAQFTDLSDQIMLIDTKAEANLDVNVLATAFNLSYTDFLAGTRISIDGFGNLDNGRLAELFEGDKFTDFKPLTPEEITALNSVPAVSISSKWLMLYDNLLEFTESPYNSDGMYYNYVLHKWSTFAISPFEDAMVYTPTTSSVTSVTVSPSAVTLPKGGKLKFTAEVETSGFASKSVAWEIEGADDSYISADGELIIGTNEQAVTITVRAYSVEDKSITGEATVTIG